MANLEGKLGDAEVRLTQVETVISTRDKEIVDLKIVMVQSEDKCYNMGFANTKSSSKLIMLDSWRHGFREGWMAAVNALGLLEDSIFRDPNKIPYLEPLHPPPVQDPA